MNAVFVRVVLTMVVSVVVGVCGCSPKAGVVVNQESSSPEQDVFIAAASGDVAKLKTLLAADRTLVDAFGREGTSPLHAAAAEGQNGAVEFLMEQGADPRVTDDNSNDAITVALQGGHKDTAKIMQDAMAAKGAGGAAK